MINWKIEKRNISDLKDHPKNPRTLSKDQSFHLKRSLEKFGLIDKPIVNLDNTIIGGHQRIKILLGLGYKEIDCWVPEHPLTEKDIDELNIRLNKNTGEWDFDILANEWIDLNLIEWGFSASDLGIELPEDVMEEEQEEEDKKLKMCPQCGHEF